MERGNIEYHNKFYCYRFKKEDHKSWDCTQVRPQKNFNDAKKKDNNLGKNAVECVELEIFLHEGLKFKDKKNNMVYKRAKVELSIEGRNREK
ncbi:hypothetical protein AYI70_g9944, partial [Smittium culicis]